MSRQKEFRDHPQKYILKKTCQILHCFGLGDFWYEKTDRAINQKRIYTIWALISNSYIFVFIINEILAYLRKDLTAEEKSDLILFSFAHPSIASKILALYIRRHEIKTVLYMLLEENRSVNMNRTLDQQSVRRAKFYCASLFINIYIILTSATIEGIKHYLEEGVPIRTEVTFLPARESTGFLVNIFRFFTQFHWWYIITVMISIDCLSICSLVFLSYKFKKVRLHYEESRTKVKREFLNKSSTNLDNFFKTNFIIGIKLHQDALRCAREVQYSLGRLYSIQVVESISLLVVCLLKLTIFERDIASVVKNVTFISCVFILNGAYMMAGGDVTYEASLIPDAVFQSGWEYAKAGPSLRSLVVVTIQRSQVPVQMTAFGVLSLSHHSFIAVLRQSYSFSAVMYNCARKA